MTPAPVALKVWKNALPITAPANPPEIRRAANCGGTLRLGVFGS